MVAHPMRRIQFLLMVINRIGRDQFLFQTETIVLNVRCFFTQDYNKLIKFFADLLKNATSTKPLFIFLDSLDNLADDYGARQLPWLPLTLPRHVKLVVSTLPDAIYQCFPILKVILKISMSDPFAQTLGYD